MSIWPEQLRLRPVRKRELVRVLIEDFRIYEYRAYKVIMISWSKYHYQMKGDGQAPLRLLIRDFVSMYFRNTSSRGDTIS